MKRCSALRCQTVVPDGVFMCEPHWAKLPQELQARVKSGDRTAILPAIRTVRDAPTSLTLVKK